MELDVSDSLTFQALDQKIVHLNAVAEQMQTFLSQTRPASIPKVIYEGVFQLGENLQMLRKSAAALEAERKRLHSLARIGSFVNSSVELDDVLQIVMDTIIMITRAERGFLMLRGPNPLEREFSIRVARNWEKELVNPADFAISYSVINRVVTTGQPVMTTNAREDPRFNSQKSVVEHNLRSILCVPLKVKDDLTGVIYADNRVKAGLFSQREGNLLAAFADQAAVAIQNARLFASLRHTLAEVTELKNLTDNVFASMASGVLTTNTEEKIVLCNRAAEEILGQTGQQVIGRCLEEVAPPLAATLRPYLELVERTQQPILGLETNPDLPERGRVDLRLSLSPLKDLHQTNQGFAVVLEDLTEKKRLEAQSSLFERMVSPAVIAQLDPNRLQLGGQRAEITVLFADIRGFTSFCEGMPPEELVSVLNRYLAMAANAVLNEGGTVDKFLGDAVMAWFNAPVLQSDHTLRAVRAAIAIRNRLGSLHRELKPEERLSFGIGIHVGEAVLGLVGTEKRLDYTAIGDCVNTAKRIQESSIGGQILISEVAYHQIADQVVAVAVDPVQAKGKRDPVSVYELKKLREE